MAYREVEMLDVKEVLRLWLAGANKSEIGRRVGVDRKTVRRYARAAEECALPNGGGADLLTDEKTLEVLARFQPPPGRSHGEGWAACELVKDRIQNLLVGKVRLSKVRKLLLREGGPDIPYSTLHRFSTERLGFGRTAATVPLVDGKPGEELQMDTGWVGWVSENGQRRRFRAWIFTPVVSRYRFVWPCFEESTRTAIEACEAAWEFYGGMFKVLLPDNPKALVVKSDAINPRITPAFLEYLQARGLFIDPARVRHPKDKGRVERAVQTVRDDCFGGENLRTLEDARARALRWCEGEYGMRRHTRTQRLPKEHFIADEKPCLLAAPQDRYDVPTWCDPKVGRDHLAQVERALYSLPTHLIGKRLRARADSQTVRFFDGNNLIKVCARQPPGGRCIDENDFPKDKAPYAMRDVRFLEQEAFKHGEPVGQFAKGLLNSPLPWTRMRSVYALLGLCKRYGDARVAVECTIAVAAEMFDVRRLERMVKRGFPPPPPPTTQPPNVIPLARYLRPASQYALPFPTRNPETFHDR